MGRRGRPDGNTRHILGPGEVTIEEVEEVLRGHVGPFDRSDSSGRPIVFGWTSAGRHVAVVFEHDDGGGYVIVRPVTAYPTKEWGD